MTKSFPLLTTGMTARTLDIVSMKHGFDKAVKMRNDFMVKKVSHLLPKLSKCRF